MAFYVHRAERADHLVSALADLLAQPPADPFAMEVVAVPARGVERWLTQQLSRRLGRGNDTRGNDTRSDGICAGIRFPSPTALVAEVLGTDARDLWAPDALAWPLLEVIDASVGQSWCESLSRHLGAGTSGDELRHRSGRRYAVARRLAGLFDAYALQRPQMLDAWGTGHDTDGFGEPLPPDLAWQPELWRRVRTVVGEPNALQQAATDAGPGRVESSVLPPRVSLFGPTRLPAAQLRVLVALGETRDVHLWLPHPSPVLWDRLGSEQLVHPIRRRSDSTVLVPAHPLLSSLGRDSRELQLSLAQYRRIDVHHPAPDAASTLLARLQADLRNDCPPLPTFALGPADRSVQVHACHGQSRQVDVLREVLVGLLAADRTLEPRDILVMCPDIEVYAPLIAAAFGLAEVVDNGHPAHLLRVRLADRALVQTNPLLAMAAAVLDLVDARVTASQVLDLAASAPVRRRFGFDDDDLETLAQWTADAGVRWGLDAPHRQPFGLAAFPQGTWRSGLDRVLLGVTMAEHADNWLGLALPLDDVGSGDAELAGTYAELVNRLGRGLDALAQDQPLRRWIAVLRQTVADLTRVTPSEQWQSAELDREFGAVAEAAGGRADEVPLSLSDLRSLLRSRLGGRPTRANFRTGNLTVCTMVPMRSVPHRVVCLLGLDDGVFPRGAQLDGDDVLARDPVVGERDRRGEDRQLLLDAVLAATEHLVITYTGADERTGASRPPCVPVGELLDTLDDMVAPHPGSSDPSGPDALPARRNARDQVLVRHPLQPFDQRNVVPGALGTAGPFSFDPAALAAARAAAGAAARAAAHRPGRGSAELRRERQPFLPFPLPSPPATDVDLGDLIALLLNPARGFLKQRLDVATRFEEDEPSDALPVELDALQKWAIGSRLLRIRLEGVDPESCRQAEWRRGTLPPGPLGNRLLDELMAEVEPLVNATTALRVGHATALDVAVPLGERALTGTVSGLYDTSVVTVHYSRLSAKERLRAWVNLVALSAGHPEVDWIAHTIGRGSGAPELSTLGPIRAEQAQDIVTSLVDLYQRGLCTPLPLPIKAGANYAELRRAGRSPADALKSARSRWATGTYPGEDADPAFVKVWGPAAEFDQLAMTVALPDEHWAREPSRFAELALRLWTPLLTAESRRTL